MEPIITTAAITGFLSLLFTEGGKTLAVESVKLALEKRNDIKDKVVEFFKPEFIALSLNDAQTPEAVKALLEAKPDVAETIQKKIEGDPDVLKELLEIIKQQTGNNSSQIIINAEKIGQVINNPSGDVIQHNKW